jgi:hypothetical protein
MAGGERRRPAKPRFANSKRPKLLAAEKRAVTLQVPPNFISTEDLSFCPFHGKELQGEELKCSVCRKGFVDRRVVHAGASGLVLVKAKKWLD